MQNLENLTITSIDAFTVFAEKGRQVEIRKRPTHGLSFCISGAITYTHRQKAFKSTPDCAVFLPMGETYELYNNEGGEFPVVNFTCSEPFTDEFLVVPLSRKEEYFSDCKKIRRLEMENGSHLKKMHLFYGILDRLAGELKAKTPGLGRAVQYIFANLDDPTLSNERIAAEIEVSEVYLRRLFLDHYKTTPKQYIIEARIKRAQQLLRESRASITEVSARCGSSSVYHFCRAFKHYTGLRPTEYRMRYSREGI